MDWSKLEGMLIFDASKVACAMILGISADTIERRIKEKYNMNFTEYKKTHLETTVLRLKQRMIKKALDGDNTCLIFTLKNISDWKDQVENKSDNKDNQITLNIKQWENSK
jgi:hypothetical protein